MEELTKEEKIQKFIEDFGHLCNSFSIDRASIFQVFCREHRTIQQSMFGVLIFLLNGIGSDSYGVDGRNERSKEIAKQFIAGYAEMEKQKFIKEHEKHMFSDADKSYYANEGEKMRLAIIESPNVYIGVPMI
jgi:hypothetical protein